MSNALAQLPSEYLESLKSYTVDESGDESLDFETTYHYDESYRDTMHVTVTNGNITSEVHKWYEGSTTFELGYALDNVGVSLQQQYWLSREVDAAGRIVNHTNYRLNTPSLIPELMILYTYDGDLVDTITWFFDFGSGLQLSDITTHLYDENNRLLERYVDAQEGSGSTDWWYIYEYDNEGNQIRQTIDRESSTTGQRYTWRDIVSIYNPDGTIYTETIAYAGQDGITVASTTLDTATTIEENTVQTTSFEYVEGELTRGQRSIITRGDAGHYLSGTTYLYDLGTKEFFPISGSENIWDESVLLEELSAPYYDDYPADFPYKLVEQFYYSDGGGFQDYRLTRREECIYKSTITAIEDQASFDISVYPNPATDYITIDMAGIDIAAKVLDYQGRAVVVQNLSNNTLDVSALPAGVYTVMITQEQQTMAEKFIKVK